MTNHFQRGKVVAGYQLARTQGYPTANVELSGPEIALKDGIYAVWVQYQQSVLPGGLVKGVEPGKYELHLLDWSGDLYGQEIGFLVVKKVNDINPNMTPETMTKKIEQDITAIRRVLAGEQPPVLSP